MSRKNHTRIVFILDRSGSMESMKKEAISGYNTFVEEQKKVAGSADMTLILFDHERLMPYKKLELDVVPKLDNKMYYTGGTTALMDAVGAMIDEVGRELSAEKEESRPEKVLFCILTDGQENASHEYKTERVRDMIKHQQDKYNWAFIFLGANQDAFATAQVYGINKAYVSNYTPDSDGTKLAFGGISCMAASYRTSGNQA
jgi:uncharacterized protein YegL